MWSVMDLKKEWLDLNWLIIRMVIGLIVQNLENKVLLCARYSLFITVYLLYIDYHKRPFS